MTRVTFQDDCPVKGGPAEAEDSEADLKSLGSEDAVSEEIVEDDQEDDLNPKNGYSSSNFYNDPEDEVGTVFSYTTNSAVLTSYADEDDTGKDGKKGEAYLPRVAVQERQWVRIARHTVLVSMLVILAALPAGYHYIVKHNEHNKFVEKFQYSALQVAETMKERTAHSIQSLASLSLTITSHAEATTKAKWPFVTLPYFTKHAMAISQSGIRDLAFAPLVTAKNKAAWDKFSVKNGRGVLLLYQDGASSDDLKNLPPVIHHDGTPVENKDGPYLPIWQMAGFQPNEKMTLRMNHDLHSSKFVREGLQMVNSTQKTSVLIGIDGDVLVPVFATSSCKEYQKQAIAGVLHGRFDWSAYLSNIVNDIASHATITAVVKSNIGYARSYQIEAGEVTFLGKGDRHDAQYDSSKVVSQPFPDGSIESLTSLSIHLYPTDIFHDAFNASSRGASDFIFMAAGLFLCAVFLFAFFDFTVRRQQDKMMERVINQDKIVSNLFPDRIRDRLYGNEEETKEGAMVLAKSEESGFPAVLDPKDFNNPEIFNQTPIADLYPSATIYFMDIAGFTSWSSARGPPEVFMLLESLYGAFDKIAFKYGIFKVETCGDSYVAICGLPEPRKRHATAVARFARDTMVKFQEIIQRLQVTLGPETSDLKMRVGLHSGQVTAGVLRGERARFQLFGDSVNTASRMETTCRFNHIQISETTAKLLKREGKEKWINPRSDKVAIKGKGMMQTCWLKLKKPCKKAREAKKMDLQAVSVDSSILRLEEANMVDENDSDSECCTEEHYNNELPEMSNHLTKKQRLIEWNVQVLAKYLKEIAATRQNGVEEDLRVLELMMAENTIALSEVEDVVDCTGSGRRKSFGYRCRGFGNTTDLPPQVMSQLHSYVSSLAELYGDNAFHNFEHASHMSGAIRKMLTQISKKGSNMDDSSIIEIAGKPHGFTNDPTVQFSLVFSALIHDVDHQGVPNAQLLEEATAEAKMFQQSVAEQNSVHKAWGLLMEEKYADLRKCIYSTEKELRRFRQLVVNVVLATDICDKQLSANRKSRWALAFTEDRKIPLHDESDADRKATLVIEHLIQASAVSHTMQHWQIYLHWNEKYFFELFHAYKTGRSTTDPCLGWYKGEIMFFDFYVMPLVKKLDKCGCFGSAAEEYLKYAHLNREEWEQEGERIVDEYKEKYFAAFPGHRD